MRNVAGMWSLTGTHPCTKATVCPEGVAESVIATATSDAVCDDGETLKAVDNGDDGDGSNNAAMIGGAASGLLCMLFLILLIGGFVARQRRRTERTKVDMPAVSELVPMHANFMTTSVGSSRLQQAQQLWDIDGFMRVVVFDKLYNGNDFLAADDEALSHVFNQLQLIPPGPATLASFRRQTEEFLQTEVDDEGEDLIAQTADFLGNAWPDVLLEYIVDKVTMEALQKGYEEFLYQDYMEPEDNPFLHRHANNLTRPLLPSTTDAVYCALTRNTLHCAFCVLAA